MTRQIPLPGPRRRNRNFIGDPPRQYKSPWSLYCESARSSHTVFVGRRSGQQVHGNTTVHWTAINAARCLHAFAAPAHIKVYQGAAKPLSRSAPKHCPEIHGEDGLAGVVGLSPPNSHEVQTRLARSEDGKPITALQGMTNAVKETWNGGAGRKVTIVSSGPMTNVAVFISAHPELLDGVEQFVFMGGGNGYGNITPAAGERS